MAFRQHVARPQPRLSFPAPIQTGPADVPTTTASPLRKRPLEDSEEWVLFTPVAPSTTRTQTTSTERTPRTAGLSRLSDFGSLDTAARSDQYYDDNLTQHGSEHEDDNEDLDSLDDGLHAFHETSETGSVSRKIDAVGQTVLPAHDGLGSFQASSSQLQDQIKQFERNGPNRRHQRRRSSVQRRLDALEEHEEFTVDEEKRQRIEHWRLEQSKALLEEIERETRRRRRRSAMNASTASSRIDTSKHTTTTRTTPRPSEQTTEPPSDEDSMSFLQRFTQRVIRDLMGIDESLLSVIFGEELPDEIFSTTPTGHAITPNELHSEIQKAQHAPDSADLVDSWEHRLLERIARELGVLVHQLSEHPGAFSSYLRTTHDPLPYAGLHASASTDTLDAHAHASTTPTSTRRPSIPLSASGMQFKPSLPAAPNDASLWGIEEEPPTSHPLPIPRANATAQEREYWERDIDAKMVFRFLLKRFSSSSSSHRLSPPPRGGPTNPANPSAAGASLSASHHRAAIIRQHHPLVNRTAENGIPTHSHSHSHSHAHSHAASSSVNVNSARRREMLHRHLYHQSTVQPLRSSFLKNVGGSRSSCKSQSTKVSKRSGSSRNYWDLGGSGSGNGWGEV